MTNADVLLRSILGPIRADLRPLSYAIDIAEDLLFIQRVSMDDLKVAQIYPKVADRICSNPSAVARRIERLTHICWDSLKQQDLVCHYLGRVPQYPPDPCMLIIFLAVYSHLRLPFFKVIEQAPHLLFPDYFPGTHLALSDEAVMNALLRARPLPVSQMMVFSSPSGKNSFPVCPNCLITMEREYQNYCDRCGQRLDWKYYGSAQVISPG